MRTIILILHFLLISSFSYAQVEDYFKPSEQYFKRTFEFITDTWETSDGRFHNKHTINYSYDRDKSGNLTGNIKRTIKQTTYRYNVPRLEITRHEFFNISNNTVTLIYSYTEGLSDELIRMGLLEDNYRNLPILKTPNTTWVFDEIETEEHYKSEFGSVSTKYGTYDCIIVTVTGKSNTEELKWVENFVQKLYYAKNIGLIKTETYDKSGKLINPVSNFGALVDDFSPSSFSVMESKKKEERDLQSFLLERKTKIYNYQELSPEHYNDLKNKLEKDIKELLNNVQESVSINLEVELSIDTLGFTTKNYDIQGVLNEQIRDKISRLINTFNLNSVYQRNYTVFANANYSLNLSHSIEGVSFKKTKSGIAFQSGDFRKFQVNQQKITEMIMQQDYPVGHYQISLREAKINNNYDTDINVIAFSSFAGPSSAFASILVPGLGRRYVTGGEQKGFGVTVAVYSLIGGGVASKFLSNSYYGKYHNASIQTDMDNYYNIANRLNKATYFLIGAGTLVWLYDIYWVASRGSKNKKNAAQMNQRIDLSFGSDFNSNLQFGLTFKF